MKRLNIFIDETGDFGITKKSSELYGISFTFHEQKDNIKNEIKTLNNKLNSIGYTNMIHMADLVYGKNDYRNFDIAKRKSIFNSIYQFSRKIPIKYKTIIIDKKYVNNKSQIKSKIKYDINKMITDNKDYFNKFDKIILYYDNGQEDLGKILDNCFNIFNSYIHKIEFDHKEKRLFQVSDMLTYIDKYDYKYKNKMRFNKSELYFFKYDEIKRIIRDYSNKRL